MNSEAQVPSNVYIARLKQHFDIKRERIDKRLADFDSIDKTDREKLFEELVFCLLTPQSKARTCDLALQNLKETNLLWKGSAEQIAYNVPGVRFQNNKARWIVEARDKFASYELDVSDVLALRGRLVRDFKGMGFKEASHFLRNIGFGQNLAILDRHILKNLVRVGAIEEVPNTLSSRLYLEIENRVRELSTNLHIGMDQLDLLFWSEETGEIFK